MRNYAVKVFDHYYMDSDGADAVTSAVLEVSGNRVMLTVTIIDISGSPSGTEVFFQLQDSYDGRAWRDLGTAISPTTFGNTQYTLAAIDAPYVRVVVTMTGSGDKMLFDATVAFSKVAT